MKTITPALKAHFGQETTTLAYIWHVLLSNGTTLGFTDHDQDITYNGVTYAASSGFTASNVETTSALNVDNLEVTGMLSHPTITEADLVAGIWDDATIVLRIVNYCDLTMGDMYVRTGTVGQVTTKRSQFVAEMRGMMQPLQQNLLEHYSPGCRARLGDARCKVVLVPYTVTGSVTSAISQKAWNDTSLTQTTSVQQAAIATIAGGLPADYGITNANPAVVHAIGHGVSSGELVAFSGVAGMTAINGMQATATYIDVNTLSVAIDTTMLSLPYPPYVEANPFGIYAFGGTLTVVPTSEYFQNGVVTWLTGANVGLSMEVKLYRIGYLELFQPMPYAVVVGDTYTAVAGCDGQFVTCKTRFNNHINFRGEPWVPGMDQLMHYAI